MGEAVAMWWPWWLALLAGGAGYAGLVEPFWPRPVTYEVAIPGLAAELDGYTVLHLSDLHGRVDFFARPWFQNWLRQSQLICVTGDLYAPTLPRRRVARILQRLAQTRPLYYCSGNHDWRRGQLAVQPWDPGGAWIDNRVALLAEGRLALAGLPDLRRGKPDWERVLSALPSEVPALLLSHRPDVVLDPRARRFALVLSGHTHGGQVVVPGWGAPIRHTRIPGRYVAGRWEWASGRYLITSRGLGESELPFRFFCRPEVVRVVLRAR